MNVAANIAAITARIAAVAHAAGRKPSDVKLLPISKTRPAVDVRAVYSAGCRRVGENRIQEAYSKYEELVELPDLEWVIVGHLQSNKAKQLAIFASEFQGLDSLALAAELDKRLHALGRQLDVLIQVNTSGEVSKSGLHPDEVLAFAAQLTAFDALRVKGLMTIALPAADESLIAPCFQTMTDLQQRLRYQDVSGQSYDELSMGMSSDFELAIAHGATCVRLGTAIFGSR